MQPCASVGCPLFPCRDVRHESFSVPTVDVDPKRISLVLVSEAAPPDPADGYYASGEPLFARTTVLAFRDAGVDAASVEEIVAHGVYLTTAVKCGKTEYAISNETVAECSRLLERELRLFPRTRAILLMGDVAIRTVNAIAKGAGEPRPIPSGPTWKQRGGDFRFRGARLFPSYLQAGPAFFIEKVKRRMIAEDIAAAMAYVVE